MSFSSEQSSTRQKISLPRQDTQTTVSSLSTSCSNLETADSNTCNKNSFNNNNHHNRKHKSNKKRNRRHSIEHYFPTCDSKTLKTLKVHYYPEEQTWGYVVLVVAAVIHAINHGLQLAYGVFLVIIFNTFGTSSSSSSSVSLPHAGEFVQKNLLLFLY